jgi:hypothetical protein
MARRAKPVRAECLGQDTPVRGKLTALVPKEAGDVTPCPSHGEISAVVLTDRKSPQATDAMEFYADPFPSDLRPGSPPVTEGGPSFSY